MRLLLDTHILIWLALDMLPQSASSYILDESNELYFSPASIWEIVIKRSLNRPNFNIDPDLLHTGLIDNGYIPIPITSQHTLTTRTLPSIHKDPFDRILLAQSITEDMPLLTFDNMLANYPAPLILLKK
ncbi:MAG: type II toxin-antitoxin system VapC family toxin [Defluviitaleaceae bacterium]|nr:type II toxin-antitoxin system VapC family toxin [Defluviitaleaceae bacterium]